MWHRIILHLKTFICDATHCYIINTSPGIITENEKKYGYLVVLHYLHRYYPNYYTLNSSPVVEGDEVLYFMYTNKFNEEIQETDRKSS